MRCSLPFIACWILVSQHALAQALRFDFSPPPLERFAQQTGPAHTVLCPRVAAPPKIDGELNDAAWRQARIMPSFSNPNPPTRCLVCYDENALYIGVECTELPTRTPTGEHRERDRDTWRDDCIEIWITPSAKSKHSFQFIVNIVGSIYDAKRRAGSEDASYNPEWEHAVRRQKEKWFVEVAIPRAAVALEKWPRQLGFNIGRNGPGLGPRSWNPQYGDTSDSALLLEGIVEEPPQETKGQEASTPKKRELASVGSLNLVLKRSYARPGDRWIEAEVELSPISGSLQNSHLRAALYGLAEAKPREEISFVPDRMRGKVLVDLRKHALAEAELTVEFFEGQRRTGAAKALLSAIPCNRPLQPKERVAIKLDLPNGVSEVSAWPVTFGVPFAAGALWDVNAVRLVNASGREIPHQKEITGRWSPDGAIQWVRFDALVSSKEGCFLEVAPSGLSAGVDRPLRVTEGDDKVTIETGTSRIVVAKGASPIQEIHLGSHCVARSAGTRGLYVVDQTGRVASASADGERMDIEARGPVAACVRLEGPYRTAQGEELARHITRIEAFAGQPFAKITHTLVLTNDTNKVWFKEIGWEMSIAPGASPRATFCVSLDDPTKSVMQPLEGEVASAYMLQDSHYRFAHGKNHFLVAALGADGRQLKPLAEGEECGDWAALFGGSGGLALACRDAARQHPKEFELFKNRAVLRLFSNRAGEALDFRAATLVEKWNLSAWYDKVVSRNYRTNQEEKVKQFPSNAIGWSKTHELMFVPLPANDPLPTATRICRLHSEPVYANVDPHWVYKSEAMGPLHPKDPVRFPEAEKLIECVFNYWNERVPAFGEYGFVDYYAGPHLSYSGIYPNLKRHPLTYTLRPDLWLLYARSGGRAIRALAERTNRTFMDGYMARWDGPNKTRGLYIHGSDDSLASDTYGSLPFYWENGTCLNISSSTNLNQFLWFYHLTGYRRAKDCVLEYADGIKRTWTPTKAKNDWRILMVLRTLTQCYGFTWDPELRAMAEATAQIVYDDEGALGLIKDRPYRSTSYKTQVDIASLIEAWELFGTEPFREMALRVSRFWWERLLGDWPITYTNPTGRIGNFLFRETGDPTIPDGMAIAVRQASTAYDPKTGAPTDATGAHAVTFVFQGIPYSQDVLVRTGADKKPLLPWVGCEDFGAQVDFVAFKGDYDMLELIVGSPYEGTYGEAGARVRLVPLEQNKPYGLDVNVVADESGGFARVRVPKDAPEGAYKLTPAYRGKHFVMGRSATQLVLHAPSYWRPSLSLRPPAKIFFKLPEKSERPQIFFEGSAHLFAPDGTPFKEGEAQRGWVDLPPDKPGMWSFSPVENKLVRVRNLPPFFAMEEPRFYFEPPIPWQREEPPPPQEEISADTLYVPGAIATKGNQALYLRRGRTFTLAGGDPHPSGDGLRFLPFKQGTIEFFLKPRWDTFTLAAGAKKGVWRRLIYLQTAKEPWELIYIMDPEKEPGLWSHVLYGWCYSDGYRKRVTLRAWRKQTIIEADRWIHVAWVWGQRQDIYGWGGSKDVLTMRIYVDGRAGAEQSYRHVGNLPADMPLKLMLGAGDGVDAAYDELRISDSQRYFGDFTPPSRGQPLPLDEHTRALFHFDGNLQGESYGYDGTLPVELK